MEQLTQWMERKRQATTDLAVVLGVSYTTVWRWLQGDRTPGRRLALRLEVLTQGEVSAACWDEKPLKGRRGRSRAA